MLSAKLLTVGAQAGYVSPYDGIPSIVAAYGMRRLLSDYDGPILRLRRSSDNTEQDIGYVANGDLDTAALASWLGEANGYIKMWYDQSGNGNHAAQTTAASQPLYVASGQNGHPTLSFDGSNDYLESADFATPLAQPNTVLTVGKANSLVTNNPFFNGRTTGFRHSLELTSANQYLIYAGLSVSGGTATINWGVFSALFNSAASRLHVNGVQVLTGNVGTETWSGIRIGARTSLMAFLNGSVAELVVVDSALSDTDRAAAESAATAYWIVGDNDGSNGDDEDYDAYVNGWSAEMDIAGTDAFVRADYLHNQTAQQEALTSINFGGTDYQAIAYYNNNRNVVVAIRTGYVGDWTRYTYDGTNGLPDLGQVVLDSHNNVTIGIDPAGYVHVSYNHHANSLNYRKADAPLGSWTGGLTDELSMLGTNENDVTYPMFFNDPAGNLYFLFRDGGSGNGDTYIYRYDHATTTWAGAAGTTAGKVCDGKVSSHNLYHYGPPRFDTDFGAGGYMHLAGHWRATTSNSSSSRVCYVRWDGTDWSQADGTAQTMPVTIDNCGIVDDVPQGAGLDGISSLDADSAGHPHIAYIKHDDSDYLQIYHAWHNGTGWTIKQLSNQTVVQQGTTGVNRQYVAPEIVIDRTTDTAYIFFWGYDEPDGWHVLVSDPDDYTTWTKSQVTQQATGYCHIRHDRERWMRDGVLDLYIAPWQPALGFAAMPIGVLEYLP